MNEQIKKLFTPVENGLPKETGKYICLYKNGFIRSSNFSTMFEFVWKHEGVIAWLDLSTITTKEAAIGLARDAFKAGRNWEYDNHFGEVPSPEPNEETFISQNENRL